MTSFDRNCFERMTVDQIGMSGGSGVGHEIECRFNWKSARAPWIRGQGCPGELGSTSPDFLQICAPKYPAEDQPCYKGPLARREFVEGPPWRLGYRPSDACHPAQVPA